ncbi:serpin family protein, partial [Paludisphaera soli]|uniref:serpin family protein n=1 Tax=Paludisphaera soli TaxID=2712865 RepID=UPI0013ED1D05
MVDGASWARSLAVPLIAAALVGCWRAPQAVKPAAPPDWPATLPLFRPAASPREDAEAVVRANNSFALDLFHRLRARPGNLLASPACLSAGLALVYVGARGETARQIARVLHKPDGLPDDDRAYAGLVRDLNDDAEDHSYQIRTANSVWVQESYPLLDTYRATLRNGFALDPQTVDFSGRPGEACRVINDWTASRTGGKIVGMLRAADLPARTRMVLTTGLYLRANWFKRFLRE